MRRILSTILRVVAIIAVAVFVYALGYGVGQDDCGGTSTLTIDELTITTDTQTIILKGLESTVDNRQFQKMLDLIEEASIQ